MWNTSFMHQFRATVYNIFGICKENITYSLTLIHKSSIFFFFLGVKSQQDKQKKYRKEKAYSSHAYNIIQVFP